LDNVGTVREGNVEFHHYVLADWPREVCVDDAGVT
jgi:hypothetical protein